MHRTIAVVARMLEVQAHTLQVSLPYVYIRTAMATPREGGVAFIVMDTCFATWRPPLVMPCKTRCRKGLGILRRRELVAVVGGRRVTRW